MTAPDLFRLYHAAYRAGVGADSGVVWEKNDDRATVTVSLGMAHGKALAAPLSRSALLAEAERLCGEGQAPAPTHRPSWDRGYDDGREAVLGMLTAWVDSHTSRLPGASPFVFRGHLDDWIAEQRKAAPAPRLTASDVLDALARELAQHPGADGWIEAWIASQRKAVSP